MSFKQDYIWYDFKIWFDNSNAITTIQYLPYNIEQQKTVYNNDANIAHTLPYLQSQWPSLHVPH